MVWQAAPLVPGTLRGEPAVRTHDRAQFGRGPHGMLPSRRGSLGCAALGGLCLALVLGGGSRRVRGDERGADPAAHARSVAGVIVDEVGRGVPGIHVTMERAWGIRTEGVPPWKQTVATGEVGEFVFVGVPPAVDRVTLTADLDDLVEYCPLAAVHMSVGGNPLRWIMRRSAPLEGRVRWAEEPPWSALQNMRVSAYWTRRGFEDQGMSFAPVGRDGRFRFQRLPLGQVVWVQLEDTRDVIQELRCQTVSLVVGGGTSLELEATREKILSGRVAHEGCMSSGSCEVFLDAEAPYFASMSDTRGPAFVRSDGRFEFASLPVGRWCVLALRSAESSAQVEPDGSRTWNGWIGVARQVEAGGPAVVVGGASGPLEPVAVQIRGAPGEQFDLHVYLSDRVVCSSIGRMISAEGVWTGVVRMPPVEHGAGLHAHSTSTGMIASAMRTLRGAPTELTLARAETLRGRLVRKDFELVRVVALRDGRRYMTPTVDVDGRFELAGLPAGQVSLVAYRQIVTGSDAAAARVGSFKEAVTAHGIAAHAQDVELTLK